MELMWFHLFSGKWDEMGRIPKSADYRGYKAIVRDLVTSSFGIKPTDIAKVHYHGRNKVMTIILNPGVDQDENRHDR